jgi:hypothetical protein
LTAELARAQAAFESTDGIAATEYWAWGTNHNFLQQPDGSFAIDYEAALRDSCQASAAECSAAIATAIRVTRLVGLSRHLHACAGTDRLRSSLKTLDALDAAWNHYFFKTRSQYIWELALNSSRFNARDDVFAAPPSDQIILAHPGVAFEYVGGGAHNDKAYEALVFAELVGYNRFRWSPGADGRASQLPPLGASIVATYSPDNDGNHVGYGVMVHAYNTLSLGVTRRDTGAGDETTWLLSLDLMRLVLNPTPEKMAEFRGKGAPPPLRSAD